MTYIPHTDTERAAMLNAAGLSSMAELFGDIPERVRFPDLQLPAPASEMEVMRELRTLAAGNLNLDDQACFLGAGTYNHYIPATVDDVLRRGEFYTSYTPYQPEISQGMLQAMFEFQSMVCRLTAMEVSNASHYDGATSLAEAVLMALGLARGKRQKVILSPTLHPQYRAVVETYLRGADATLADSGPAAGGTAALTALLDGDTAALVIQSPNFYGQFEALDELAAAVHDAGALLIVVADPIALGLFRAPGDQGADIVVADGQPLGIPPSFGGPHLGILATRKSFVRGLAGRLVGATTDAAGARGFVLTLGTREQHIRRERATSNICTNAALTALAATVYLATMGRSGLRRVAELCYHKSHYAAAAIAQLPGVRLNPQAPEKPFFKEFVVELPKPAAAVNQVLLAEYGIIGGYDLGREAPDWERRMLIAVTEMNSRAEIDGLVTALEKALA